MNISIISQEEEHDASNDFLGFTNSSTTEFLTTQLLKEIHISLEMINGVNNHIVPVRVDHLNSPVNDDTLSCHLNSLFSIPSFSPATPSLVAAVISKPCIHKSYTTLTITNSCDLANNQCLKRSGF